MIVVCVSSRLTVSSRFEADAVADTTNASASVGRVHDPNRAMISRRASSTVTAPTTAMTVVSGRACSR